MKNVSDFKANCELTSLYGIPQYKWKKMFSEDKRPNESCARFKCTRRYTQLHAWCIWRVNRSTMQHNSQHKLQSSRVLLAARVCSRYDERIATTTGMWTEYLKCRKHYSGKCTIPLYNYFHTGNFLVPVYAKKPSDSGAPFVRVKLLRRVKRLGTLVRLFMM